MELETLQLITRGETSQRVSFFSFFSFLQKKMNERNCPTFFLRVPVCSQTSRMTVIRGSTLFSVMNLVTNGTLKEQSAESD